MSLVVDTVSSSTCCADGGGLRLLEPYREPLMVSAVTVHEIYAGMRPGEEEGTETMLSSFGRSRLDWRRRG